MFVIARSDGMFLSDGVMRQELMGQYLNKAIANLHLNTFLNKFPDAKIGYAYSIIPLEQARSRRNQ